MSRPVGDVGSTADAELLVVRVSAIRGRQPVIVDSYPPRDGG